MTRDASRSAYCSACGSALPQRYGPTAPEECAHCGHLSYRVPSVVSVAVVRDSLGSAIWLVRRDVAPMVDKWALPGGYVEVGETPASAAVRECSEEMRVDVHVRRLVGVYSAGWADQGVVVIAYEATLRDGDPHAGDEVREVRAFPIGSIPQLAFDTHEQAIREWRATLGLTR
jgi:8-oxo-dGTP diphosphatase